MSTPNLRPADLSGDSLSVVASLEQELGSAVVAYAAESPYADLDDTQIGRLRQVESDLGVRLVAYSGAAAG